ncbi:hypothetical protein CMU21_18145 [Elizabethkingia anophelis]|nr:hypothetical protein [Elizabethkingia anophelis]
MENKLIPMTEFTLQKCKFLEMEWNDDLKLNMESHFALLSVRRYAQFLKQPRELWMFVPCDEDNVPLKEPIYSVVNYGSSPEAFKRFEEDRLNFEQAKSRVLFEGFFISKYTSLSGEIVYEIKNQASLPINEVVVLRQRGKDAKFLIEKIEDLIQYNLTLSATAIKSIYGS